MRKALFGIVALFFAVTAVAAAGGEKGDWEIGLFAGVGAFDDYSVLNPKEDQIRGARVGGFVTSAWSIEFSFQRLRTRTDFDPALALPDFDLQLDGLRLNLLYNFLEGKSFRPFVTVGVGKERLEAGASGTDRSETGYTASIPSGGIHGQSRSPSRVRLGGT